MGKKANPAGDHELTAEDMGAAPFDFALEEHLPYLINRISLIGVRFFSEKLGAGNLTVPMWRVIAVLWSKGAQRQVDLSDLTSIDRSTLSRLVGALSKRKLVTRERSASSSREVTIRITNAGEILARQFIPEASYYEAKQTEGLSQEERALLRLLLKKVYNNVQHMMD